MYDTLLQADPEFLEQLLVLLVDNMEFAEKIRANEKLTSHVKFTSNFFGANAQAAVSKMLEN